MHDHLYVFAAAILAVAVLAAVAVYSHSTSAGVIYRAGIERAEVNDDAIKRTNALIEDGALAARRGQTDAYWACAVFAVVALVSLWKSGVVRM